MRFLKYTLCLSSAMLLAACGSLQPADNGVLTPNPNLLVQGVPPVPMSLVRQVAPYTDFRGQRFLDWSPSLEQMLVAYRPEGGDTQQLFQLGGPMEEPEPLTRFADPVTFGTYEPRAGRYIVFAKAADGNEVDQLYRLDLDTRVVSALTRPNERHAFNLWLHGNVAPGLAQPPSHMLFTSVPVDHPTPGGAARPRTGELHTTLTLMDPLAPEQARTVATLPGTGWRATAISADDRTVALQRDLSANQSEVWLLALNSSEPHRILPEATNTPEANYSAEAFQADGQGLLIVSDRAGEFKQLMRWDLKTSQLQSTPFSLPWDVSVEDQSEDGSLIAVSANEDGLSRLHLLDGHTFQERPLPALPTGSITRAHFHRATGELALSFNSNAGPSELYSLNPASGQVVQWTQAEGSPELNPGSFQAQHIVRWRSFDGREISGIITRADPRQFPGKRPVLISIHGGPASQATFGFNGRLNFVIDQLGVTIIRPNVRGSAGYGKTFLSADNGKKREDSVKDIGALLDWIATQPDLDASRVLVTGGSYGGYMSLAVATHYGDRIVGNVDVVGISNFVTFLTHTESYRRDLRRTEYGDERDPQMRAFLESISPLNNAGQIGKPMLVVQGRNDPRVPYTEAEQMVNKLRERDVPVWYVRGENEGHGFRHKENADYEFYATVLFMQQTLLKPADPRLKAAATPSVPDNSHIPQTPQMPQMRSSP